MTGDPLHKTAFITGVNGQDGAYLAKFLLGSGYRVHGLVRWDSYPDADMALSRLSELKIVDHRHLKIHTGNVSDANTMTRLIGSIRPDEIYNLAALSQVHVSFGNPAETFDSNLNGTLNILEAIRNTGLTEQARLYQASSSEIFGNAPSPQNEDTQMQPQSPYAISKLAAYWLVRTYRKSYGIFAVNGISFNHESPLRGGDFVTQKIADYVAAYERGLTKEPLKLGNLEARRDWGAAEDYVRAMHMVLALEKPDDFVLATGQNYTVREFAETAFSIAGISLRWSGEGSDEVASDTGTGKPLITIDPALYRPAEVEVLQGDASKIRKMTGWRPEKDFKTLITSMVNARRARYSEGSYAWQTMTG